MRFGRSEGAAGLLQGQFSDQQQQRAEEVMFFNTLSSFGCATAFIADPNAVTDPTAHRKIVPATRSYVS